LATKHGYELHMVVVKLNTKMVSTVVIVKTTSNLILSTKLRVGLRLRARASLCLPCHESGLWTHPPSVSIHLCWQNLLCGGSVPNLHLAPSLSNSQIQSPPGSLFNLLVKPSLCRLRWREGWRRRRRWDPERDGSPWPSCCWPLPSSRRRRGRACC
jgi:hypothetical protein